MVSIPTEIVPGVSECIRCTGFAENPHGFATSLLFPSSHEQAGEIRQIYI